MASEFEQNEQGQQDGGASGADGSAGAGGADDLSGVLGEQEVSFVSGEKKPLQTGTLIMAGFLLCAGAGTYLMYKRSAPADTLPTPEAQAAQSTITAFLTNDKANAEKMRDLLENTEKAVEQFRASPGKKQIPVEELQTNPFSLDSEDDAERPVDANLSDVALKKREAEQRAATLKAAQALNLQFIVTGKKKSCLINNVKYTEGQTVGEFTIESISPNSVVVRKDDQRFELKMKKSTSTK